MVLGRGSPTSPPATTRCPARSNCLRSLVRRFRCTASTPYGGMTWPVGSERPTGPASSARWPASGGTEAAAEKAHRAGRRGRPDPTNPRRRAAQHRRAFPIDRGATAVSDKTATYGVSALRVCTEQAMHALHVPRDSVNDDDPGGDRRRVVQSVSVCPACAGRRCRDGGRSLPSDQGKAAGPTAEGLSIRALKRTNLAR